MPGVLLAIVTVVLVGIPVLALVGVHENSDPHRPDIAAITNSAAVSSADASTTADMHRIDAGLGSLPWLAVQATSVQDTCESRMSGEFFAKFGPVTCGRSTTYYLAFDGDLLARTHEIGTAIEQAGWQAPANGGMAGLWKAIPLLGKGVNAPTGDTLELGNLPASSYADVFGTGLWVDAWGRRPTLRLRDCVVTAPRSDATDAVGVRQFRGVDASQVIQAAYRTHMYVVEIQLRAEYFNSAGPLSANGFGVGVQC